MKRFFLSLCIVSLFLVKISSQQLMPPAQLAVQNVQVICNILRIPYIQVYSSYATEFAASMLNNGNPVIIYNSQFLDYIASAGQGGPIYVFAHEICHIANLDLSWYGRFSHPWSKELRADYIGGYILGKMNFSVDQALNVHRYVLFTMYNTNDYPNSVIRMEAIKAGYLHAFE